jgi:lipid A 4'-phosphatase
MQFLTHRLTIPLLSLSIVWVMRLFIVFPELDLMISDIAHGPKGFVWQDWRAIDAARNLMWNLTLVMFGLATVALVMGYTARWPHRVLTIHQWGVMFWGYLLGPGILVNAMLKAFSGRVRPVGVQEFGGTQVFTAVGDWTGKCSANCSFVSGEVAGIAALCISVIILLHHHSASLGPKTQRSVYIALAVSFGFVVLQRILSGGHFTSDAVLSALLTGLVFTIVARALPHGPQRLHLGA